MSHKLALLALLWLTCTNRCHALPFITDLLSTVEVSVPAGDGSVGTGGGGLERRRDEQRVEDHLRLTLQRMSADTAARTPSGPMADPLPVAATVEQEAAGATFRLTNIGLSGMRQYTVDDVSVDLAAHEYSYRLQFPALVTRGQYVLEYYWTATEGDFHISLHGVTARGRGLLDVHANGTVRTAPGHSHTEVAYQHASADLGSPGIVNTLAQTAVGILGPYLFEAIKPFSVQRVADYLSDRSAVYVSGLDEERRPSGGGSFGAIDAAVLQLRQRVRAAGFDPLPLPTVQRPLTGGGGVQLALTDGALTGLSGLRRTGELSVAPLQATAKATMALGTGRVTGRYRWTLTGFDLLERSGFVRFSVDGIGLRARLAHRVGTDQRPRIEELDVDIGAVSFRCEGAGRIDYLLNLGTQSFPAVLKNVLAQAVETPLVWIIENQASYLGMV